MTSTKTNTFFNEDDDSPVDYFSQVVRNEDDDVEEMDEDNPFASSSSTTTTSSSPFSNSSSTSSIASRFRKKLLIDSNATPKKEGINLFNSTLEERAANKENILLGRASITKIEKPTATVAAAPAVAKKKEKYKPMNLAALIKPAGSFSPPKSAKKSSYSAAKAKQLRKMLNSSTVNPIPASPSASSQEIPFEITCSGNFQVQDLKISNEGISYFPDSFLSQTQSQSYSQMSTSSSSNPFASPYSSFDMMSPHKGIGDFQSPLRSPQKSPAKSRNAASALKIKYEDLIDEKALGSGASSSVRLVRHRITGTLYAKKIITTTEGQAKLILNEIKALRKCHSSNHICKFFDAYYREKQIHILLEYMDGNSLYEIQKKIGQVPENIIALIAFQVLKGMQYLHAKKKIIHRDIKPANILIKKTGDVKISDFGLTGITARSTAGYSLKNPQVFKTCQGTILYMSPERIQEKEHSFSSDIWSLGMTLAELRMGKFPMDINVQSYFEILDEIQDLKKLSLPRELFSDDFKDFIHCCVKVDPDQRHSASQLLTHKFIQKHAIEERSVSSNLGQWLLKHLP